MSNKKKKLNVVDSATNDNIEEVIDHEEIYSVKLNSDAEAIFANVDIELCKEEALKHTGYKIFDENNEEVNNPWEDKKVEDKELAARKRNIDINRNLINLKGLKRILSDTPVYQNSGDETPVARLSGEFYHMDNVIWNYRAKIYKITINKTYGIKQSEFAGWVSLV